jgi:hypothetical protein
MTASMRRYYWTNIPSHWAVYDSTDSELLGDRSGRVGDSCNNVGRYLITQHSLALPEETT